MERAQYNTEFIDQTAFDEFVSLPKAVQKVLGKAIKERLEVDPVSYGKPLRYSLKGHRRLRVGDYRIVYRIDDKKKTVLIVAIDHRKDIYDKFD